MQDIEVIEFQREFTTLNLKFMKEDPKGFEYAIIVVYMLELEKGFKVKKICKTYSRGTKVNYIPIKDDTALKEYSDLIREKIQAFNDRWNTSLELRELNQEGEKEECIK